MGYKNQAEYEKAAIDFWEKGEGVVYYSRPRNTFYKYDVKTCKEVAVSPDGIYIRLCWNPGKSLKRIKFNGDWYVYREMLYLRYGV